MHWTEPATSDDSHAALEKTLWDAANQLWAGASLKPSEYSPTVLGLIFLRYADVRFAAVKEDIQPQARSRRKIGPTDFHAAGVVYLPDEARFSHLLSLPESGNVGQAINQAMCSIEKENPDLADVLPKNYHNWDVLHRRSPCRTTGDPTHATRAGLGCGELLRRSDFAHHSSPRLRTAGATTDRVERRREQSGAGWEAFFATSVAEVLEVKKATTTKAGGGSHGPAEASAPSIESGSVRGGG
jgi:hypothetical protein